MMGNPGALDAVREEAEGLGAANAWDLSAVVEKDTLFARARMNSVRIHMGQRMTLASEKFAELAPHLRVLKGIVVFRGDIVRDEDGALAAFQDLHANPSSVAGIDVNITFGRIPGHKRSHETLSRLTFRTCWLPNILNGYSCPTNFDPLNGKAYLKVLWWCY
jgi:hypothetical protein